ncbi:hypothetical protein ABPG72_007758 [Tetrahymena utriculariae]
MFTPNDQGYYQPFFPQEGQQMPRQQDYHYPYMPPPPALSNSGALSGQTNNQFYELQNMHEIEHSTNLQQTPPQKAFQSQKLNEKIQDQYETPTDQGDDFQEESKYNRHQKAYQLRQQFKNDQQFNSFNQSNNFNAQNSQYINIKSGMAKLHELQGIYIKQRFDAGENLSGCEQPNIYKVYPADCNGDVISNQYIFKCKEKSSCCARNCIPGSKRPFNMIVKNRSGQLTPSRDMVEDSNFLLLRRPYKCTCFCLSRPELEVFVTEQHANKILGKITQPFYFCSVGLEIQDLLGNVKYTIEGESYCMPAIFCGNCPCRSCQQATFIIKNTKGEPLSYITKRTAGCWKSCASDKSNFGVTFPHNANVEDKILIMAATLFLDYSYFEESITDRHGQTSHINLIDDENKKQPNELNIPLQQMN